MERECRYVVIKTKDILDALTDEQLTQLVRILDTINAARRRRGKCPIESVVVEDDWPEYEVVWSLLEARVDGVVQDGSSPDK